MSTNNRKKQKQNASSNASPISSQRTSAGKRVKPTAIDGDKLLLHLTAVAQELHGQSKGIVERLCQEIVKESQGLVRLVLLNNQDQLAQITPSMEPLWVSRSVEYAGRFYGQLEVAPHPTRRDQPALLYQHIQLLAASVLSFSTTWKRLPIFRQSVHHL